MHYRSSALLIGLLFALYGSAEAQQQTGPYIQVSPTPSKLSVGGPGFVQIDANGIASIAPAAPGTGTVTNTAGALAPNSMIVGNGGADIKTIGGSIGGTFTTAGAVSLNGAAAGLILAFPSGGPFTYTFPLATSTLASLAGAETFTNKIYNGGQLSGSFSGNPTFLGIPLFTNLLSGTQTTCLGLDSTFHLVTSAGACGSGGGSSGTVTQNGNLTTHAPLIGGTNGTTDAKATAAMINGQVLLGSTGADPVPATIAMGAGLNGATGAGSFTITPAGRTAVADANCATLTNANSLLAFTTVLTAVRSCTLPAASAMLAGQRLCFVDEGDGTNPAINGANTVTLNRAGSDKINGATSFVMGVGYAAVCLESDASAKWSTVTNQNISAQAATSNNFLTGIGSDGVFTRAQPAFSNLSGAATPAQIGGSAASHAVPVDVAGTSTYKVVPDCTDTGGNHINYTQSTDAFSCGTSSSGGGGGITCPTGYTATLGDCTKTLVAAASASLTFPVPATYTNMTLTCNNLANSGNVVLYIQFDEGGGLIGGTSYTWSGIYEVMSTVGTVSGEGTDGTKGIRVAYSNAGLITNTKIHLQGLTGGSNHTLSAIEQRAGTTTASRSIETYTGEYNPDTTAVVNVAILPDSGTFSGTCTARLDPT